MHIEAVGAVLFGIVAGWVTYRTLRREDKAAVSDIASVLAAVGGAAVTGLFEADLFGWYSVGLFVGFFSYLVLGHTLLKDSAWLGSGR